MKFLSSLHHSRSFSLRSIHFTALKTPNPKSVKFVNEKIKFLPDGSSSLFVERGNNLPKSKFVAQLFEDKNLRSALIGPDFITLTLFDESKQSWADATACLTEASKNLTKNDIEISMQANVEGSQESTDQDNKAEDSQNKVMTLAKAIIENKVRPFLQEDGGDAEIVSLKNDVLYIRLQGACSGCPISDATLKNAIEGLIKHYVPEIKSVEKVEEDEIQQREFEKLEENLKK